MTISTIAYQRDRIKAHLRKVRLTTGQLVWICDGDGIFEIDPDFKKAYQHWAESPRKGWWRRFK